MLVGGFDASPTRISVFLTQFWAREVDLSVQEMDLPNGEVNLLSREVDFPNRETDFLNGEIDLPSRETNFPNREVNLPSWEINLPSREIHFPNGEIDLLNREIDLLNRNISVDPQKIRKNDRVFGKHAASLEDFMASPSQRNTDDASGDNAARAGMRTHAANASRRLKSVIISLVRVAGGQRGGDHHRH
jgi:hypothetical protein